MSDIHPAPAEFSPEEVARFPILRFFHYAHLPPALQGRSRPFCELARLIFDTTPNNGERATAFRKLLEAKDCAVRAALENEPIEARIEQALAAARAEGMREAAKIAAGVWPRGSAHTYASEHADVYLAQEDACVVISMRILSAIGEASE